MAKNNLTRHEELRYSYLLSNLQYLNNREKQEFDYLYQKKVTANRDWANNYTSSDENESYQDYDNYIDQNEFEDNSSYTSQGIPRYPKISCATGLYAVRSDPVFANAGVQRLWRRLPGRGLQDRHSNEGAR